MQNVKNFIKIIFPSIIIFFGCNVGSSKENSRKELDIYDYINEINTQQLDLPLPISIFSKKQDTLDYIFKEVNEVRSFKLFFRNQNMDTLKFEEIKGVSLYKEGDLDGDGLEDIGIMIGYPTSSCRVYEVYGFKKNKWKLLYSVNTHLPDRAKGVDYFRNMGDRLRIIEAKRDECCQCDALDTTFLKFTN